MPLIFDKNIISDGYFIIWKLEEPISELSALLPDPTDYSELETISHPQKIKEWLAGRYVLYRLCRACGIPYTGIRKDGDGKPFLLGTPAQVSLSHSRHYVGAVLKKSGPIGLDIERPDEKLIRVASKFLSFSESGHAGTDTRTLCMYWCAKEAVFKLNGRKGISFREQISIAPFSAADRVLSGALTQQTGSVPVTIYIQWIDDYCTAVAVPV